MGVSLAGSACRVEGRRVSKLTIACASLFSVLMWLMEIMFLLVPVGSLLAETDNHLTKLYSLSSPPLLVSTILPPVSAVPVSITHLETDSLTAGQVNGQPAEDVFSDVLLRAGGTFTGPVTFEGDVTLADVTVNGEGGERGC